MALFLTKTGRMVAVKRIKTARAPTAIRAIFFHLVMRTSMAGTADFPAAIPFSEGNGPERIYLANTFFKRSVVLATGLALIFASSSPTIRKRPSKALVVTWWLRSTESVFTRERAGIFPIIA